MNTNKQTYFGHINESIKTLLTGLRLSFRHIRQARKRRSNAYVNDPSYFEQTTGRVTLRYPDEAIPVPDNGRYRLYNEMEDCIVCDKCAKVCPVDCIDIEAVKSSEVINYASDGSPIRLYAARFDIDMAKCCYCGLCTTVCPTECLTMTKAYDFSEFDILNMNYHFTNLTPEQAEDKRQLYEQFVKEKAESKERLAAATDVISKGQSTAEPKEISEPKPKPVFKPTFKKTETQEIVEAKPTEEKTADPLEEVAKPKPVFKPTFKKPPQ